MYLIVFFNTEDFPSSLEPAIPILLEIGLRGFMKYGHTSETAITYQNPEYKILLDYV